MLSKLQIWHCPNIGELEFRGLLITEKWRLDWTHITMTSTITLVFSGIVAAKFLFGWETAWNVGCFLVSFISLAWMWTNHFVN